MTIGLLELGEMLLGVSERRLEAVSRNVANLTTPGYKASVAFQDLLTEATSARTSVSFASNFTQGGLHATGMPFDLALSGPGFFRLRTDERAYYVRSGQFERTAEGRLVNSQGMALQTNNGEDLIVGRGPIEFVSDGTVLEGGLPVARLGVFAFDSETSIEALGGALFRAPDAAMREVEAPLVRQGMLENANVDLSREMVDMMAAMRQAEIGARIVQTYDGLIGQSITTFGRTSR